MTFRELSEEEIELLTEKQRKQYAKQLVEYQERVAFIERAEMISKISELEYHIKVEPIVLVDKPANILYDPPKYELLHTEEIGSCQVEVSIFEKTETSLQMPQIEIGVFQEFNAHEFVKLDSWVRTQLSDKKAENYPLDFPNSDVLAGIKQNDFVKKMPSAYSIDNLKLDMSDVVVLSVPKSKCDIGTVEKKELPKVRVEIPNIKENNDIGREKLNFVKPGIPKFKSDFHYNGCEDICIQMNIDIPPRPLQDIKKLEHTDSVVVDVKKINFFHNIPSAKFTVPSNNIKEILPEISCSIPTTRKVKFDSFVDNLPSVVVRSAPVCTKKCFDIKKNSLKI